ncbi:MAG: hypothetical protein AAFO07_27215 [Bacteroidota bacterium]
MHNLIQFGKTLLILLALACLPSLGLFAQNGGIKGIVVDELTNQALSFATESIEILEVGTVTTEDDSFELNGLDAGTYNITITSYLL